MGTSTFCGQCGTGIPAGNKFCTSCGTPSGVHQAITPAMAAASLSPDKAAAGKSDPAPPAVEANGHATIADGPTVPLPPLTAPPVEFVDEEPVERPTGRFTPPSPPAAPPKPSRPERGKGRWVLIGGIGAALLIVAVVVIVLITSGSGSDSKPPQAAKGPSAAVVYQQQVAKAFGPVLGANEKVSARLASLSGTKPDSARLAVRQAQQATTAATGALNAMTVPNGEKALAASAQQVIDRQVAYLAGVASVLNHPTVAGASSMQTLSSNLVSALHAAGPTIAGEQETVSGADRLTSWARTTSRTLNRRAAAKRAKAKRARENNSGSSSSSSSTSTSSAGRGTPCGSGVFAGPNTSCAFALNVRDAYADAPGAAASVRVYSPVTNTTYTMDCRPSGNGITCSGGNGASVTF